MKGIVLLVCCFLVPLAFVPGSGAAGESEMTFASVESWDGHKVPITIYRPLTADATHQVPLILHSHGWAGSRAKTADAFKDFVTAGFGVLSIDMRGHGDARQTSEARVHHIGYEVRDVSAVIDYVATLPWVTLDAVGDPRIGAIGGSYGGAFQLLSAARDGRLDALAPEITWNDLVQSLVPNGAPKSAWIDLLYGGGNAQARLHPSIHEAFAFLETTNRIPDGSVPGTTDLKTQFTASSAKSYPTAIDVPTLFVQGATDTLFNFNEAVANYRMVKATGAPVRLVTHLGGHILNTQGTIPIPAPTPIGLQSPTGPSPCGAYRALAIAWFEEHLLGQDVPAAPEVCLALEDGTTLTGDSFPLPDTKIRKTSAGQLSVVPGSPATASDRLLHAGRDTTIAGIPHLSAKVSSLAPDAIVYLTLVAIDGRTGASHVVDAQVTPIRVDGSGVLDLDLAGIATTLRAGDSLDLVASGWNEQFGHNSGRVPGLVVLSQIKVDLPIVDMTPGRGPH